MLCFIQHTNTRWMTNMLTYSVKCVHRMQMFSAAPEALTAMFKWFFFSFLNTLYILFIFHFVFLPLLCILSKACVNSPIGKKNSIRSIRSFNKRWRVYLDDVHSKNIWFNFTNLFFFPYFYFIISLIPVLNTAKGTEVRCLVLWTRQHRNESLNYESCVNRR